MSTPRSKLFVTVAKRLTATPEIAFDAWLDPRTDRPLDVRRGAARRGDPAHRDRSAPRRERSRSSRAARAQDIDHVGRYLAVDRPRRLEFTWGIAGGVHVARAG